MIFFVTGSGDYPFTRLLDKADQIQPEIGEKFILQTGKHIYQANHCNCLQWIDYFSLLKYYQECDLIVSHASSGPLIYAAKFLKPIILVPRRKHLGEAVADHQIDTINALRTVEDSNRVILDDLENLPLEINNMLNIKTEHQVNPSTKWLTRLHEGIRESCGLLNS